MHRPGIEPGPPAWQASILPQNLGSAVAQLTERRVCGPVLPRVRVRAPAWERDDSVVTSGPSYLIPVGRWLGPRKKLCKEPLVAALITTQWAPLINVRVGYG